MKSNQPHHVFGKPHPTHQVYECDYQSYEDLREHLSPAVNPIRQWRDRDTRLHAPDMNQNQKNKQGISRCYEIPTPGNVSSSFRNDEQVAFFGSPNSTKSPLTYAQLQKEIQGFSGYHASADDGDIFVVAVLLPPALMAETAVVLLTLLAQHQESGICVAPLDPNMPPTKIQQALAQLQCTAVVTSKDLYSKCQDVLQELADIRLVEPTKSTVGVVDWTILRQGGLRAAQFESDAGATTPALLLRTSGTTSTPKLVPLTTPGLLYNATCLATSLQLDTDADVGCNVMPLFHIGGIACGLLTVLVSGSSVVMLPGPFESHAFLDAIESTGDNGGRYKQPTWYYGVPSMHKALILTAKARNGANDGIVKKRNNLRFVRSGAAHLPHETAVQLAHVLQTNVMPTYSMSECMPVCSGHHLTIATNRQGQEVARPNAPQDTVGVAIGSSSAILDEQGQPLPYGQIGQVCLKGPGVVEAYLGLPRHKSHTSNGWFQTGDMGVMDANGNVVLSGRSKELIKRGGDQVWPNEVDSTVETVEGVRLAVTFGVFNELWGEEVHVAVVLEADQTVHNHAALQALIAKACTDRLGAASAPSKIHFLESPAALLKGPTGKYLRTKMADHLGAQPVDTGALMALEAMASLSNSATERASDSSANSHEMTKAKHSPTPSSALNGVRFLTACFVVHYHIGLFPNAPWLRIQSFTFDMTIFFLLGAFQLTTSIKSEVQSNSVQFVGTKIGSMHALFLVSQIIAFGSYLLFQCGDGGYQQEIEGRSCATTVPYVSFLINTLTGLVVSLDPPVNAPAWFQSAFYIFLFLFPTMDKHLRSYSNRQKRLMFGICLVLASFGYAAVYWAGGMMFTFMLPSWLPALVAGMIAGYWFQDFAVVDESDLQGTSMFQRPRVWGLLTDCTSLVFLFIVVMVAIDGGCVDMTLDNYQLARPNQPYQGATFEYDGEAYVEVCDLTYDEFVDHVHEHPDEANYGRWTTEFGGWIGFCRMGTPLVLLWLWGLAQGRGMTARIMKLSVLQRLAPYAYPLYLLHVPVARFYWVMTRGHEAQAWWDMAPLFPFPVEWYEFFVIVGICLVLAKILDRFVVQHLSRYTIAWGVQVCRILSKYGCCCLLKESNELSNDQEETTTSTMREVSRLVRGLTGEPQVDRSTLLQDLGLDSLGATALLGTLRASVESAKSLTMAELSSCETVGDLVDLLEARGSTSNKPPSLEKSETVETFASEEV